jgi:predicted nicotinamide N-methyase
MESFSNLVLPLASETAETTAHHEIFAALAARYDIITRDIRADGKTFTLCAVRDTNRLLDMIDPTAFAADERLPYWAELWPASVVAAQYLLTRAPLTGMRVLELGCGLGLAGIAAAAAGGTVVMTDYDEDALLFAAANAMRNVPEALVSGRLRIAQLDWRKPGSLGAFDHIIGADIVYERGNFAPLLSLLHHNLAPHGCALFTDPGRQTAQDFFAMADEQGFYIERNSVPLAGEGGLQAVTCAVVRRRGDAG